MASDDETDSPWRPRTPRVPGSDNRRSIYLRPEPLLGDPSEPNNLLPFPERPRPVHAPLDPADYPEL